MSPTARDRFKSFAKFLSEYWDLLVAALAGLAIVGLGLGDVLTGKALNEATVGVLAALATTQVRDRWRRDKLGEAVQDTLAISAGGRAWHVLRADYTWDLSNPDGTSTTTITKRVLRFLSDDVAAIHESAGSDGQVVSYKCQGAPIGGTLQDLKEASDDLPGPSRGRKYRVFVLPEIMQRGERFETVTTRSVKGAFARARESVWVDVLRPTDEIKVTLIWSKGRPPTTLSLRVNTNPSQNILGSLGKASAGRKKVEQRFSDPQVGDSYQIEWDW